MAAVYHVYKLQFQTQFHCYMTAHGITCRNSSMHAVVIAYRAGGISPAAPVLAGPVFSQGKSKIPFLQKASNK